MRHLHALADAGLTDVHLLPVFDFATVPEPGCVTPVPPAARPDSEAQQAAVMASAATATASTGATTPPLQRAGGQLRQRRRRRRACASASSAQMVMALHRAGLRVGMDVVYNHTTASGQNESSVLDRIVPGYYHRLDATGEVERIDLLRQHRHREPDDGQADDRLGACCGPRSTASTRSAST